MYTERILTELRSERDRLNHAIAALEGISPDGVRRPPGPAVREVAVAAYRLLVENAL